MISGVDIFCLGLKTNFVVHNRDIRGVYLVLKVLGVHLPCFPLCYTGVQVLFNCVGALVSACSNNYTLGIWLTFGGYHVRYYSILRLLLKSFVSLEQT